MLRLLWVGVVCEIVRAPPLNIKHFHEDSSWTEVFGCYVSGIIVDMAQKRLDRLKELKEQTTK